MPEVGEKDKLNFETLAKNYEGLLDLEFKTAAAGMVALGWILSSQQVHDVLSGGNPAPAIAMTIGVVTVACVYCLWVRSVFTKSRRIYKFLNTPSSSVPSQALKARKVTTQLAVSVCIIQIVIFALIIFFSWHITYS